MLGSFVYSMNNHLVSITNERDKTGGGMFSRVGFRTAEVFPILTKRDAIVTGKDRVLYVSKVHKHTQEPDNEESSDSLGHRLNRPAVDSQYNRQPSNAVTHAAADNDVFERKKSGVARLSWMKANRIMKHRNAFATPGPTKYKPRLMTDHKSKVCYESHCKSQEATEALKAKRDSVKVKFNMQDDAKRLKLIEKIKNSEPFILNTKKGIDFAKYLPRQDTEMYKFGESSDAQPSRQKIRSSSNLYKSTKTDETCRTTLGITFSKYTARRDCFKVNTLTSNINYSCNSPKTPRHNAVLSFGKMTGRLMTDDSNRKAVDRYDSDVYRTKLESNVDIMKSMPRSTNPDSKLPSWMQRGTFIRGVPNERELETCHIEWCRSMTEFRPKMAGKQTKKYTGNSTEQYLAKLYLEYNQLTDQHKSKSK